MASMILLVMRSSFLSAGRVTWSRVLVCSGRSFSMYPRCFEQVYSRFVFRYVALVWFSGPLVRKPRAGPLFGLIVRREATIMTAKRRWIITVLLLDVAFCLFPLLRAE